MNKRGFTLIELLAVIVILAIIALIATPIILNMINSAKKSAAKSAALGYIEAIEYNNGFAEIEQPGYTSVIGENLNVTDISIKVKGKKPSSGTVTVNSKGKVESANNLCFNGYEVDYDGKDAKVKGKCSGGSTPTSNFGGTLDKTKQYSSTNVEQLGLKGVAYIDPTDLSKTCNKELAAANVDNTTNLPTGIKKGCMKFYIYDDSNDEYTMILDHSTTACIVYNTTNKYVEYDLSSIKSQVELDTEGWVGNPRLITGEEIATITNTTTFNRNRNNLFYFDGTSMHGKGTSSYKWLYDYTNGCTSYGCDTVDLNTFGYWTTTPVNNYPDEVWMVDGYGYLRTLRVNYDNSNGIRPVITIEKSQLQ